MKLHDRIVNELITHHSLSALIRLIEQGRELEFTVENRLCFISTSNATKSVSLWVDQIEQSFDRMEALIQHSTINAKPFLTLWQDALIETLF